MNAPDQSDNKTKQKMSFKDFLNLTKWAFLLLYKIQPKHTIIYLITTIAESGRGILNTFILSRIIDQLIVMTQTAGATIAQLYPYIGLLFGFNLTMSLFSFLNNYSGNVVRNSSRPKIRTAFYTLLNNLGIQTLEQPAINNLINRADRFLWNIVPYVISSVELIGTIFTLVASLTVVIFAFPSLAVLTILSTIPFFFFDKKFRGIMYGFDLDNTEESRKMGWVAADLSSPKELQEIKITGAFSYLSSKHNAFYDWFVSNVINIVKRWQVSVRFFRVMSDTVVMFGYLQVFARLLAKTLSVGDVTFHVRNLSSLQDSLMTLFRRMNDLMESSLQLKEAYQLFQTKPAFPDGDVKLPRLNTGPEIRLTNVDFHYPNSEKKVIENLSIKINPGEKVAIVGHNGAGKTTLVKLLSRIYQTSAGEIFINGTNINELAIDSLYQNMGVIFQDYNNYSQLTVRDNIYMGRSDEPMNETAIRLAAQAADADDFIQEYPNKYDQILSERFKDGVRPSTGQWQKLAIARFFYRNAPLVIFDEPTAAIDPVSEYNIFNKIYEFFENKTVIIISHKFSTVRNADRILVMEKGKIIEEGTHDHLLGLGGKYAEAFMLQAKGYASKSERESELEQTP